VKLRVIEIWYEQLFKLYNKKEERER